MILQALRTNKNVSSELALKLFDKQIVPILLYGCSIWGVPKTHNLIYLEEQPENINTRNAVANMLKDIFNRPVPIEYARRVGKRPVNNESPRRILIKLKFYNDKEYICREFSSSRYKISNFVEKNSDIEKVHFDFCKKSLNMSKYASNTAIQGELGRMPIFNIAKGLAIKYWLRLTSRTENKLLNQAFKICKQSNHDWIQSMLCENGFADVWVNPVSVNKETFHKYFKTRLNDQHIQNWNSIIQNSSRFTTLRCLHDDYKMKKYVTKVKDPNFREIFTRLRIDMNLLKTSKSQGHQQNDICLFCELEPETVDHFLLRCSKYQNIRMQMFTRISSNEPYFSQLNETNKLCYILDLKCCKENVILCCKFLYKMYKQREVDSMQISTT